jgi:hypothetical protein
LTFKRVQTWLSEKFASKFYPTRTITKNEFDVDTDCYDMPIGTKKAKLLQHWLNIMLPKPPKRSEILFSKYAKANSIGEDKKCQGLS